ncbi:hypothetical protein PSEUBRA_003467 [Kalmanozyma brasiliensis GHG001]|uniref:Uncharacterized protein n=1 Tax=Kalmanozyma brasiliensis (strain GHG001) TaxID=1365824 RepID=V5EX85_KALBG|nr:uncharacterized protein PSEUBRA_003467 [Kalmanozyma brasiliensis GHG001]EST07019.1 hypothetical protein PSEUBRA_003467 [Kalmanozyma brasiliensis GHG001]
MTDNEPRQLLPETESHHNLSSKLGASRPLPPRSRGSKAAKSPLIGSKSLEINDADESSQHADDDNLGNSHDSEATARSPDGERADLEARGTASPVPMAVQRVVSSSSVRSMRSNDAMTPDIPKEEIEKALEGLDRDDLVVALGRAKVQMDEIEARLDQQVLQNETLHDSTASLTQELAQAEAQTQSLQTLVKQREERIDEIMADQERMEGEVYSTMQIIERLRKQLSDSERSRSDAEKRYLDQTATMDKERQYYQDTEALLKSQKATQATAYDKLLSGHNELLREHERVTNRLASIKASAGMPDVDSPLNAPRDLASDSTATSDSIAPEDVADADQQNSNGDGEATATSQRARIEATTNTVSFAEERDVVALTEELATLQKSHSSLSETMFTLQAELRDVRAENVTLRDQNETFMDILQEKTFSGALLNESAMLRGIRRASLGGRLRARDGLDDPYDDEYTTESDSLSIDVDEDDDDDRTGGTSVPSGTIPEEDEEDLDDVPDTPKAPPKQATSSRRRRADSITVVSTTNLASELEGTSGTTAPVSVEDIATREKRSNHRIGTVSDSVEELQQEVRELREANQALTLYISKIIDRIISREGYEHVLAIESRGTARGPRHKSSRANLSLGPTPKKAASNIEDDPGSRNVSNASNTSNASNGSATSFGSSLFGFGAASSGPPPTTAPKKSKRTSSIDWRNLPFLGGGSSSTDKAPEANANLRPLALQPDNLLIPARDNSARKVRTSEEIEDEHDVAERERIRQELLTRGIQPPKHQLVQSPTSPPSNRPPSLSPAAGTGGFAAFFSRVVGGASASTLSPTGSDFQSQASSTPVRSADSGLERAISSTPAALRDAERTRALQLSAGSGSSLTKLSGGPGIASRARQQRAERHQQTLDVAAEYPFPSSLRSSPDSRSGASSVAESSMFETSIAGDESYYLPSGPPSESGRSPLEAYGGALPPLPHETTGEEDERAVRSPAPTSSQDQGWKRAFRRISLLGATSPDAQQGEGEPQRSPLATPTALPTTLEHEQEK